MKKSERDAAPTVRTTRKTAYRQRCVGRDTQVVYHSQETGQHSSSRAPYRAVPIVEPGGVMDDQRRVAELRRLRAAYQ